MDWRKAFVLFICLYSELFVLLCNGSLYCFIISSQIQERVQGAVCKGQDCFVCANIISICHDIPEDKTVCDEMHNWSYFSYCSVCKLFNRGLISTGYCFDEKIFWIGLQNVAIRKNWAGTGHEVHNAQLDLIDDHYIFELWVSVHSSR